MRDVEATKSLHKPPKGNAYVRNAYVRNFMVGGAVEENPYIRVP